MSQPGGCKDGSSGGQRQCPAVLKDGDVYFGVGMKENGHR